MDCTKKKYIRFDVLVKEERDGIGRTFDLEMQMVDTKELPLRARFYEFENREKNDPNLTLGDLTYKYFCNFSSNESNQRKGGFLPQGP